MKPKKTTVLRFIITASLVLLFIGILNFIILFSRFSSYQNVLEKKIEEIIQREISIDHIGITFFKGWSIALENVIIKEKNKRDNFLIADRLIIKPSLIPLLRKQIIIKQIHIIHPVIQIYRSKEGEINLINWINSIIPHQQFSKIQSKTLLIPRMKKLVITNGDIVIKDMQISEAPLITKISDFYLEIKRPFMRKSIISLIKGEINISGQISKFKIRSEIKQIPANLKLKNATIKGYINVGLLNLNHFQPYLKHYTGENNLAGIIDANINYEGSIARGFKSLGVIKSNTSGTSQTPALLDPGHIHRWGIIYDLFWEKDKLDFRELKIKLNDTLLTGKCFIQYPFSKNPFINLEIVNTSSGTEINVESIPFDSLPKSYRIFKDRVTNGSFKFDAIKFEGNFNQIKNIHKQDNFRHLSGKISINNIDLKINSNWPILRKVTGTIEFDRGNIKLSNVSGAYKDSTVSGLTCIISNPLKNPVIDLSASATFQLDQIKNTLLNKIPVSKNNWNYNKINKISGKVKLDINLSGNLEKPWEFDYFGNAEFINMNFSHNDLKYPLKNINGKTRFYSRYSLIPGYDKDMIDFLKNKRGNKKDEGLYFYISSLSGKYNKSKLTNVTGGVFNKPSQTVIDLRINSDVDLKETYPLIASRYDTGLMGKRLNKINILSGRSRLNIAVTIDSSRTDKWNIIGDIQLSDVFLKHDNVSLKFSKLNGDIHFAKDEIKWENLTGMVGNSKFTINGTTPDYLSQTPGIDMQFSSNAYIKDIISILPVLKSALKKEDLHIDGVTKIELALKGNYQTIEAEGEVDLTESSFRYKNWINKKIGKKNIIHFIGSVESWDKVYVNKLKVALGDNIIVGEGIISGFKEPDLSFSFNTSDFDLGEAAKLASFFNSQLITGKLSASFNIKGSISKEKQLEIAGKANLRDGSYKFDFSPNKIKNINGNLEFDNQKVVIDNVFFSFGKSDVEVNGEIENFDSPRFSLKLKSKNLDLNQILPHKKRSIKEIHSLLKSYPVFLNSNGKIHLDAKQGKFSFLKFPRTTGEIQLKRGIISFNHITIFSKKNHLTIDGFLNFLSEKGLNFSIKLHGKSFPAADFENIFEKHFKNSITGRISISTQLKGRGFDLNQITKSLSGNLSLLLVKGHYNKQNLISGIINILKLKSKSQNNAAKKLPTEFNHIKGNFNLKNGVAITNNYIIETPKRKTSIIGNLDMGNKKLDLSVGVAPWRNFSKAMSRIPIVGTILTGGDDKSILINYFSVKGKMGSPKISPVPIKSLSKKVISLFKGVFQTPGEILAPTK